MKISVNEIRLGNVLEHDKRLWVVTRTQHVKPGKGPAYMQVEMKDILSGTKLNERFRSADTVERARLDEDDYQYLYGDADSLTFMQSQTYEQITLPRDILGDQAAFLADSMMVRIASYEGRPLSVQLPDTVILKIVEADAVVKGQTAASSYKPAILENGVKILVPPFIESGTRVVVRIEDQAYIERAKN